MCLCGWCMRYSMPCFISIKSGYVGAFMYPLRRMVRYWRSQQFFTVMCMSPTTQWFSDLQYDFSIFFGSSPIRGVAIKSFFSKDVSTGNGNFCNFTSSFTSFTQYSFMIFFLIWSAWSILIPYLRLILSMLRRFSL